MRSLFKGLLTIWIIMLLIVLGIILNFKNVMVDTTDNIIKKEVTDNIVDKIENYTNKDIPDEVINKIENTIENNKDVKKIVNNYFDEIIDILISDESNVKIDVAKELNNLIDDGETILNENNITIQKEEKQKLLSIVSTEEVNNLVNSIVTEAKQNMNSEIKMVLKIYNFLTSPKTKFIIITLIIVSLILIALLNKSTYLWLSNFSVATIFSGIFVGILIPFSINNILNKIVKDSRFSISTSSLITYGYILIALGIICIIIKTLISMILKRNTKIIE